MLGLSKQSMDKQTQKLVAEGMRKARSLSREHANFFDWHNKDTKELHICSLLINYLNNSEGEFIESYDLGTDPPDCIATSKDKEVGIEIVELVDQKAIENQIRYKWASAHQEPWTRDKLMTQLNKLIQDKDSPSLKSQLMKKYERYIVLIHTDEPELRIVELDNFYSESSLKSTELVTDVYLLFSYDPNEIGCPIKKLR